MAVGSWEFEICSWQLAVGFSPALLTKFVTYIVATATYIVATATYIVATATYIVATAVLTSS